MQENASFHVLLYIVGHFAGTSEASEQLRDSC